MSTDLAKDEMDTAMDEDRKYRDSKAGRDTLARSTGVTNPLILIQSAIDKGVDADYLGKLLDLQERWTKNRAVEEYNAAMSRVQSKMPAIIRDKVNTQTNSRYARYETLNAITKPIYSSEGFSLNWTEGEPKEGSKTVHLICDVRHKAGHTVRHEGWYGLDDAGMKGTPNKTPVQAKGSTYAYGRRYMEKLIWNLAEADEDNDGQGEDPPLNTNQIKAINDLFDECADAGDAVDSTRFYTWLQVESMHDITQSMFAKIVDFLKRKKAAAMKAKAKAEERGELQ